MNKTGKRILIAALILILLSAAGIFIFKNINDSAIAKQTENKDIQPPVTEKEKPQEKPKSRKFETNEDIRQEYGRLEVVYLFSGKKYEGAVISTDEFYTMVTVNGIVKIPMKDVKIRKIIK